MLPYLYLPFVTDSLTIVKCLFKKTKKPRVIRDACTQAKALIVMSLQYCFHFILINDLKCTASVQHSQKKVNHCCEIQS